jgi:glutamate-ammonia-ligase adenylyltransferase
MEPAEQSRTLVASLCGYADWPALLAAIGEARQRISARWTAVRENGE